MSPAAPGATGPVPPPAASRAGGPPEDAAPPPGPASGRSSGGPDGSALRRIRAHNARTGAWPVVLDDDPTGSQAVHDVAVVIEPTAEDLRPLARERRPVFIWTNGRALPERDAAEAARRFAGAAIDAARWAGVRPVLLGRGDSTLRGHVAAEMAALETACREAGADADGVVFVPAYLEAGRFTADDVQWVVRPDGRAVPAAHTEFARDATFGYREVSLRDWVAARTARPVCSISLADLRRDGGIGAVRILRALTGGAVAVANARTAADLEALALACQAAERGGRRLLYRTGPSFVRALLGQPPRGPLTAAEVLGSVTGPPEPGGAAASAGRAPAFGLTVVGSHTALTGRQFAAAARRHRLVPVELDVGALLRGDRERARAVDAAISALETALVRTHCALVTSRAVRTVPGDPQESLAVARRVSAAVCAVVAGLPAELPLRYVVAKGGITSHDVAVRGLGMRRATVLGQLFPGQVSVLAGGPGTHRPGMPYVVFPGNVGAEDSLARVLSRLDGDENESETP